MYDVGDAVTLTLAMSPHVLRYTATDNSSNFATCDTYISVAAVSGRHTASTELIVAV